MLYSWHVGHVILSNVCCRRLCKLGRVELCRLARPVDTLGSLI